MSPHISQPGNNQWLAECQLWCRTKTEWESEKNKNWSSLPELLLVLRKSTLVCPGKWGDRWTCGGGEDKSDTLIWRPAKGRWDTTKQLSSHYFLESTLFWILIESLSSHLFNAQDRPPSPMFAKQTLKKTAKGPLLCCKELCPQTLAHTPFQFPNCYQSLDVSEQDEAFLWRINRGFPQLGCSCPSPTQEPRKPEKILWHL